MKGLLVLENGARFEGDLLKTVEGMGELVFNTGMTGYQECFTDPSYEGDPDTDISADRQLRCE